MKLSVIVPSYNVSNYLEECIESIVQQEISSMEVLIINDGSTDNTLEIAYRLEQKYDQVKVINQKNGGLGNARNTGIAHSVGEYITFVDSDDVIEQNAYTHMLNTIENSGSDFVIGNVVRFNSTRTYASVLHKKVFFKDLIGVNIHTNPELLYDTTAWNKIFRRSFWDKYQFRFPEGMLYEDIPVTIPAHALADNVDVLTQVVYRWRARDAGDNSITQQKEKIENFIDRTKAIDMVKEAFAKYNVSNDLKDAFDYKNLSMDFPLYLGYMLEVEKEYQIAVNKYVKDYLKGVSSHIFMQLSVLWRIKYRLIMLDRFDDFLKVIRNDKLKLNRKKPIKTSEGLTFDYQFIDVLSREERMATTEFSPVIWIENSYWEKDVFKVSGVTYLRMLSSNKRNTSKCRVFLKGENSEEIISINNNLKLLFRPDVTLKRGVDINSRIPFKRLHNYNYSGYEVEISMKKVLPLMNENEQYQLLFEYQNSGIIQEYAIQAPLPGYKTKPNYKIVNDTIVAPTYNASWELNFTKSSLKNSISDVSINDGRISLSGQSLSNRDSLVMICKDLETQMEFTLPVKKEGSFFKAEITSQIIDEILNISDYNGKDLNWEFYFEESTPLMRAEESSYESYPYQEHQITIIGTQSGKFRLRFGEVLPIVQDMTNANNQLTFTFSIPNNFFENAQTWSVLLMGEEEIHLAPKVIDRNQNCSIIESTISLSETFNDKVYTLVIEKTGDFQVKRRIFDYGENDLDSSIDESVNDETNNTDRKTYGKLSNIERLPIYLFNFGVDKLLVKNQGTKYELYHPFGKYYLKFKRSSYWDKLDDGPRRQEVVRRVFYPLWRKLPILKNVCVLESFWGREFSDNPKAIYDYLNQQKPNMKYIIPLQDTLSNIDINNSNTEVVKLNSWKYLYYLARAKYFFNNVNFPDYYHKRKNAVEVQTMHGTPLKKLGLDNPGEIPDHQVQKFIEKCERWDYLTIPSDYVGEIAQSAYRFNKQLLKTGYPRNDSLFNYSEELRLSILNSYQLPKDKKIILYAPTWRVKGKFSMPIDLQQLKESLGDEYIIVIKLHHYMIQNFSLDGVEDFAFVFGKNSIISDFYKVADLLITDYSSVMFDFALLNKPMLFFTYDYDNYKNNLRDLYFDFKEEAPGPLLVNTEEIIAEIKNIDTFMQKYQKSIQAFNKKFVQYDKGHATEELIKRIMD